MYVCIHIFATRVKPIFHYNAKPLSLGLGVGLDPQRIDLDPHHNALAMYISCCFASISFALGANEANAVSVVIWA